MTRPARIATVCARGGSRGVPGKNLLELDGEPLVARAVRQAREADLFAVIAVTSDARDILAAGERAGADLAIERPAELATDEAGKLGVIRHAVEVAEASRGARFDVVVDLDVTTPLREPGDIRAVIEQLESTDASIVLTASPARRSPYFNLVEADEHGAPFLPTGPQSVVRRQDTPEVFDLSGAVYAWERDAIESASLFTPGTRLHLLPWQRVWDIDEPGDLEIIRCLLRATPAREA